MQTYATKTKGPTDDVALDNLMDEAEAKGAEKPKKSTWIVKKGNTFKVKTNHPVKSTLRRKISAWKAKKKLAVIWK